MISIDYAWMGTILKKRQDISFKQMLLYPKYTNLLFVIKGSTLNSLKISFTQIGIIYLIIVMTFVLSATTAFSPDLFFRALWFVAFTSAS